MMRDSIANLASFSQSDVASILERELVSPMTVVPIPSHHLSV